jgi:hypothetical protein
MVQRNGLSQRTLWTGMLAKVAILVEGMPAGSGRYRAPTAA